MTTDITKHRYPASEIVPILMERDGITREEAEQQLFEARREAKGIYDHDALEESLSDHFGLEPDYIMELL